MQRYVAVNFVSSWMHRCFVPLILMSVFSPATAAEVVLVPVAAQAESGAYGSVWNASIAVFNAGESDVELEGAFFCSFECSTFFDIPANSSSHLPVKEHAGAQGALLHVTRGSSDSLHFGARFWNEARAARDAGTTMPVVTGHDFSTGESLYLPMIPLDENSRLHLRVYEVSEGGVAAVRVRFFATLDSRHTLREEVVDLPPSSSRFIPQFALIRGLESLIAELDEYGPGRLLGVEITPLTPGAYWAFASLTNNVTQHVTAFYPDR